MYVLVKISFKTVANIGFLFFNQKQVRYSTQLCRHLPFLGGKHENQAFFADERFREGRFFLKRLFNIQSFVSLPHLSGFFSHSVAEPCGRYHFKGAAVAQQFLNKVVGWADF